MPWMWWWAWWWQLWLPPARRPVPGVSVGNVAYPAAWHRHGSREAVVARGR